MQRYFLYISYLGTHYSGWQMQPNAPSVQETLMRVISTILRQETKLTGAGRTDAGVHAKCMPVHFDVDKPIEDMPNFLHRVNAMLPFDISAYALVPVEPDQHARFDAFAREYEYHIIRKKSPFLFSLAARFDYDFDVPLMNLAASYLLEVVDFTSFSKLHTDVKTNNCDVRKAIFKEEQGELVFYIQANRFLRNMVRAIVGTLLDVGRHKVSLAQFKAIIAAKDRGKAGFSVPAKGLYLTKVEYEYISPISF